MRKRNTIKVLAFSALFLLLFIGASALVTRRDYNYEFVKGFYNEPSDTLDVVYIGSSGVFTSSLSPIIWERSGITLWDLSTNAQRMSAARSYIELARKKQPNALYLIYTGSFYGDPTPETIHVMADHVPFSISKLKLIHDQSEWGGIAKNDRAELYVPMIRFHSRWNELTKEDFHYELPGTKAWDRPLFYRIQDVSENHRNAPVTDRRAELPQYISDFLTELLDYCESENVNALFVTSVSITENEEIAAQLNTIRDMCQSRGFPVFDQEKLREQIGLDYEQDYYNVGHTNIHGALKVSDYLADYLSENYDFTDKRGDPAYASWDEAVEKYAEVAAPYVLDIEWNGEERDNTLDAPELTEPTVDGMTVEVSWGGISDVDGYRIYRKADAAWEAVATVDAGVLNYSDELEENGEYTYTVIGFREQEGTAFWGRYDYAGKTVDVK